MIDQSKPLPGTLFKYVRAERVDVIEKLRIRFTPRSAFNDPFDLLPVAPEFREDEIDRIVLTAMKRKYWGLVAQGERLPPEDKWLKGEAGRLSFAKDFLMDHPEWVRQEGTSRLASKIDYAFGILSLTEVENDLLMWAHYADEHRGMVVEFDPRVFKPPSLPPLYGLDVGIVDQVEYSEARPVINWTSETENPSIFLTKSPQWSYEREWRAIRKLSDADTKFSKGDQVIHLFNLAPEGIRRVIVGCRMAEPDVGKLLAALRANSRLGKVKLQVARVNADRFYLDYVDADRDSWKPRDVSPFPPLKGLLDQLETGRSVPADL